MGELNYPYRSPPIGAEVTDRGVRFRVWAPTRKRVSVVLVDHDDSKQQETALESENNGYYSAHASGASAGSRYYYQLDDESKSYPDPASRFQPQGAHGPSEVIDPNIYSWKDANWPGVQLPGQVLYELHIGTFTREGNWAAAADKLSHLRDTGITILEVMPVAEFPGQFGWGYDGVHWFAPTRLYGTPDDFRAFVDTAHALGIGVILDVVYNHFGPSGNYAGAFSPHYFSDRHATDWGEAINFDGEQSGPVRELVAANAAYWIREYHLDGLRLDATQSIFDDSTEHIVTLITRSAHDAAGDRSILMFAENEPQLVRHVEPPERGGYGMDALWNDDFHHAARVAATGNTEGYYVDYEGTPQELISTIRLGYLYQGQWNLRQGKIRGTPTRDLPAQHLVHYLQNHDQVANSAAGMRTHLLTTAGRHRALTALLLLGPATPMLFMGQEFGASTPFLFFADHESDLAALIRDGRWSFLHQFPRVTGFASTSGLRDPSSRDTFEQSKLNWDERERNVQALDLHRDLLRLRREDPVFARQDKTMIEGAVAGPEAFVLRWFGGSDDDRLMLINLGRDFRRSQPTEPLMAPPPGSEWQLLWSSDDARYGGFGTAAFKGDDWYFAGHAAVVLSSHTHGRGLPE